MSTDGQSGNDQPDPNRIVDYMLRVLRTASREATEHAADGMVNIHRFRVSYATVHRSASSLGSTSGQITPTREFGPGAFASDSPETIVVTILNRGGELTQQIEEHMEWLRMREATDLDQPMREAEGMFAYDLEESNFGNASITLPEEQMLRLRFDAMLIQALTLLNCEYATEPVSGSRDNVRRVMLSFSSNTDRHRFYSWLLWYTRAQRIQSSFSSDAYRQVDPALDQFLSNAVPPPGTLAASSGRYVLRFQEGPEFMLTLNRELAVQFVSFLFINERRWYYEPVRDTAEHEMTFVLRDPVAAPGNFFLNRLRNFLADLRPALEADGTESIVRALTVLSEVRRGASFTASDSTSSLSRSASSRQSRSDSAQAVWYRIRRSGDGNAGHVGAFALYADATLEEELVTRLQTVANRRGWSVEECVIAVAFGASEDWVDRTQEVRAALRLDRSTVEQPQSTHVPLFVEMRDTDTGEVVRVVLPPAGVNTITSPVTFRAGDTYTIQAPAISGETNRNGDTYVEPLSAAMGSVRPVATHEQLSWLAHLDFAGPDAQTETNVAAAPSRPAAPTGTGAAVAFGLDMSRGHDQTYIRPGSLGTPIVINREDYRPQGEPRHSKVSWQTLLTATQDDYTPHGSVEYLAELVLDIYENKRSRIVSMCHHAKNSTDMQPRIAAICAMFCGYLAIRGYLRTHVCEPKHRLCAYFMWDLLRELQAISGYLDKTPKLVAGTFDSEVTNFWKDMQNRPFTFKRGNVRMDTLLNQLWHGLNSEWHRLNRHLKDSTECFWTAHSLRSEPSKLELAQPSVPRPRQILSLEVDHD